MPSLKNKVCCWTSINYKESSFEGLYQDVQLSRSQGGCNSTSFIDNSFVTVKNAHSKDHIT